MRRALVLALLCAMAVAVAAAAPRSRYPPKDPITHTLNRNDDPVSVDVDTNRIVDQYNREVYFHGVNVVVKGFPWIPNMQTWSWDDSFTEKDMAKLQELGLNGIRLGTMWPGTEAVRYTYNMTYLQALATLVGRAGDYGIYSLMDMHQDVFSEKFCGEGVPLWAALPNTTNFPIPIKFTPYNVSPTTGIPTGNQCSERPWAMYYFTEATGNAFQNFYDNYDGLLDSFAAFWKQVAMVMKPLKSYVMGYELMNEPWPGAVLKNPLLIIPGIADSVNLQPAWTKTSNKIREVDTTHSIFFEPVVYDWVSVGFTDVPGGSAWRSKSVLAYHFYKPPMFSVSMQFEARVKDARRLGCGAFLTEFGLLKCAGCGADEMLPIMKECDEKYQSWLIWEYKPFTNNRTGWSDSIWFPNGTENYAVASMLARTYAQVVAGVSQVARYDTDTYNYILVYAVSSKVTQPVTKIYLNERMHYPNGFKVSLMTTADVSASPSKKNAYLSGMASAADALKEVRRARLFKSMTGDSVPGVSWNHTAVNHIQVLHDPSMLPAGTLITVEITPV